MTTLRRLHRLAAASHLAPPQFLSLRVFVAGSCLIPAPSNRHRSCAPGPHPPSARALPRRFTATAAAAAPFKLVLYSKPDCPLCDKLKEKLAALMERSAFVPSVLTGAELEVRDILTSEAWATKYAMSVPVLAAAHLDGSGERELPRPSPRLTADGLEKHLAKVLVRTGGE